MCFSSHGRSDAWVCVSVAMEAKGGLAPFPSVCCSVRLSPGCLTSLQRATPGERNSANLKHQISIANSWQRMVHFRQSRTRLPLTSTIKVHAMKHGKRTVDDLRRPHEARKPNPEPRAIVQCERFRCIGVQKADGRWVGLGGEHLDVLEVISWVKR